MPAWLRLWVSMDLCGWSPQSCLPFLCFQFTILARSKHMSDNAASKLMYSVKRRLPWMIYVILLSCSAIQPAHSQQQKVSLKDSTDRHLDLSDWVLTANGFIPVPIIITEPAVGGFGGGIFALFIDPNTPYQD